MKGYFVLLCILFVIHTTVNVFVTVVDPHGMRVLKTALDFVLYGLCLYGGYGLMTRKIIWTPMTWRMIYHATLVMGGFFFLTQGFGDRMGIEHPDQGAGMLNLIMTFLKYLLFAIPVILYEHALRKGRWPGDQGPESGAEG